MTRTLSIISREDLAEKIRDEHDFTLIEALPEEQFRKSHLPGAMNLPSEEIEEGIEGIAPERDRTIVVYCAGPSCTASDQAAAKLVEMGYTDVYHYRGGKQHWKEGGLRTETGEAATAAVPA